MLISEKILAALNEQVGNEFSACLQYTAIAAHFDSETLPLLSAHFFQQAEEEKQHAHKFIKFIVDTGGKLAIPAIPAPQNTFPFVEDAVKLSLEQEKNVSAQVNHLVHMAKTESDYTTDQFLQWFVQEQLEEVASMEDLLAIVQRAGEGNLLRVEEYLARKGAKGGGFRGGGSSAD
ncbi:MAG: bacterioferritin [Chthoniobacter sp.]|jgi:ferritin|nr:bacterioferritin [Chthoniobacter sp.]